MLMKTVPDSLTQIERAHEQEINPKNENEITNPNPTELNYPEQETEVSFSQEEINGFWQEILKVLSKNLKKTRLNTWIKPCKVLSISETEILISVKNEFTRKFIMQSFSEAIYQAVKEVLAASVQVRFIIQDNTLNKDLTENTSEENSQIAISPINEIQAQSELSKIGNSAANFNFNSIQNQASARQTTFAELSTTAPQNKSKDSKIDPYTGLYTHFRFDNFVVSKSNLGVVTFAKAIIEDSFGSHYQSLFIKSDVGLGKTHLLNAVAQQALENDPMLKVRYVKAEDFLNDYILSLKNKSYEKFKKKFRAVDLLLFDEIQFLDGKQSTQQELSNAFDAIINNGGKIILSSNQNIDELKKIDKKLKSRLQGSLISEISALDFDARLQVIKLKSQEMNIEISEDQQILLAQKHSENVRELEGALLKISALSNFSKDSEVDQEYIANLFNAVHVDESKNGISITKISQAVAQRFNLKSEDLQSKKRAQAIAQARHIAIFLSHELLELSYQRIGDFFGGRKHSSIIYSIKTIQDQVNSKLSNSNTLKKCLDDIRSSLRE